MEQTLVDLVKRVETLEGVVRTLLSKDIDKRSQQPVKAKTPKQKQPCEMCGTEMSIFPKLPCGHKIRKKCLTETDSFGEKFAVTECPICNQYLGDSLINSINKSFAKKQVNSDVGLEHHAPIESLVKAAKQVQAVKPPVVKQVNPAEQLVLPEPKKLKSSHEPEEQLEECNVSLKFDRPVRPPTNEEWDSDGLDDLVNELDL